MARSKASTKISPKLATQKENVQSENVPRDPFTTAIFKILNDCQKSVASHSRCLQNFKQQCKQFGYGSEHIITILQPAIERILLVFKREPAIERLVKFLVDICTKDASQLTNDLMNNFIRYLLSQSNAKDKSIRFRSCQFIALILAAMDGDAEISEELFEDILACMLLRVVDKIPAVRLQAISALSRVQGEDEDDPVVKEYVRILTTDSNKDCRRAVLKNFAITELSIDMILLRVRDTHTDVRKEAYKQIKKLSLTNLSIKQRNWLLKSGLEERDAGVKKACGSLIGSWLKDNDSNILKLLQAMDAENYESENDILLQYLFEDMENIKSVAMPPYTQKDLTPEKALFWRKLCEVLANRENNEALLDSCLPDTVQLCELINGFSMCSTSADTFILRQLLKLTHFVDLQDEAGRRQLDAFCRELLSDQNIEDDLIPAIMKVLRVVYGRDKSGYTRAIMEIVSNLRDPIEGSSTQEATQLRDQLEDRLTFLHGEFDELKAEGQMNKEMGQDAEAETIQQSLLSIAEEIAAVEKKVGTGVFQDEGTWLRMLTIVKDVLQHIKKPYPEVQGVIQLTILPALELGTDRIRKMALTSLGLYCLLDREAAKTHLLLFTTILAEEPNSDIKMIGMKAISDLITIHGESILVDNGNESQSTLDTLKNLLLDTENNQDEVVVLAAQVFAKLSLFHRVSDVKIIQRLLLMYFDPATETIVEVRQCLSVFFQAFVSSLLNSELVTKNVDLLRQALIPTLLESVEAPRKSTLAKVPISQVCQYVISLLDVKLPTLQPIQTEKSSQSIESKHDSPAPQLTAEVDNEASVPLLCTPHDKLAKDCCMYILYKPAGSLCKTLSQALSLLTLSSKNQDVIRQLRAFLENILTEVKDKNALRYLKKVQKTLETLDTDDTTDPLPDVDQLFEDWRLNWENTFGLHEQAKKPKAKRGVSKKKKENTWDSDCSSESSSDSESDGQVDTLKENKKHEQAKRPKAKRGVSKRKKQEWDSDCSSDSDVFVRTESDELKENKKTEGEKTRRNAGRKQAVVSYREESSAGESSEDESSYE